MSRKRTNQEVLFGQVRTPKQIGELSRAVRKSRGLTLEEFYHATALSTRFMSEFERGKEHVSLKRALIALENLGLDVVIVPRTKTQQVLKVLSEPNKKSPRKKIP